MSVTVTPEKEELLAMLNEIAQFAEANSESASGHDKQTWAVHARNVRDATLRLAAKPDEDGVRKPLYEFSDAELRREVERRGLI